MRDTWQVEGRGMEHQGYSYIMERPGYSYRMGRPGYSYRMGRPGFIYRMGRPGYRACSIEWDAKDIDMEVLVEQLDNNAKRIDMRRS